ncbi:unnamed protein product [Ilex paraguariensis]|uniref:COG4 transport protein middle alpha-helical bundle domain-containing protein n=1 Tax=Ilex paraguariensis TaxID=185542 RepID=A0ABC8S003_9AQUA
MRSRLEFEQLVESMEQQQSSAAATNQNQFKDIVLAIEENNEILRSNLCGEDGIVYAICELQNECDSRGSLILKKYMEYRKLAKLTSEINTYKSNLLSVGVQGPDPREIELYLEEILQLTQLGEDYTDYMVSKIRGLSSVDPELLPRATRAFRSGNFSKVVQEITGYYVILEGFFMVENVRKAISIDEHVLDSLTTSMVDDVFYVLQSCCRRSISTSNINSVIEVLSSAVSLLGGEYNEALQQKMREPNLGAKLFMGGAGVQKTGTEIATALNNMDVSCDYALKLRHEIEDQCSEERENRAWVEVLKPKDAKTFKGHEVLLKEEERWRCVLVCVRDYICVLEDNTNFFVKVLKMIIRLRAFQADKAIFFCEDSL